MPALVSHHFPSHQPTMQYKIIPFPPSMSSQPTMPNPRALTRPNPNPAVLLFVSCFASCTADDGGVSLPCTHSSFVVVSRLVVRVTSIGEGGMTGVYPPT
jgi:hypothetical protein